MKRLKPSNVKTPSRHLTAPVPFRLKPHAFMICDAQIKLKPKFKLY
jgi:hypothetical protein